MNHESYEDEATEEPTADCCAECGALLSSSWQIQNPGIQVCEDCFYGPEAA